MKQIRSAALSRHTAPSFLTLSGLELIQIRKLPWLGRLLFFELLGLADFASGRISTSYAVLEALLDFDVAPQTNTPDKATQKRLRVALADLVSLGLVKVDRIKNEKVKGLFLKVKPRAGISAPDGMRGRLRGRPLNDANLAMARPAAVQTPDAGQTAGQGVQEKRSNPLTPLLSTEETHVIDVREIAAKTKHAIAKKRAEARGAIK